MDKKITVIPVNVKAVTILRSNRQGDDPIRRALNCHFGFPANYQRLFCLKQDIMIRNEFPRFNMQIWGWWGTLVMPDYYEFAHRKMEWFLKNRTMTPFVFKFSVTELGVQMIKGHQRAYPWRAIIKKGTGFRSKPKHYTSLL